MSTSLAPLLRAGTLCRPLAALCLRPRPLSPLLLKVARRQHAALAATSVLVRAVAAAERQEASQATTFTQLGISPELQASLAEKGISEPTEIQAAAVPALLRDRRSDHMLASHTGSGKTLAYLLPIVQLLKESEALHGTAARPKRPRALVLGPTRELTDQILRVAKALAHTAKFRSGLVNGGTDMGSQREALERALDVLVGTPQRVMQHAEKSHLYYGDVEVVVLDEADTMFDRGFGPEVKAILAAVRSKPQPARCVLVSATMSKQIRKLIDEEFPGMKKVETASLHRGVVGARHTFLPLPPNSNKLDLLLQVVEGEHQRGKRVMVFCNTLASCRAADHFLQERGLQTACYHGDVPVDERRAAIQQFAAEVEEGERPPLLVCTDLAARGLDVPGRVSHVVNFDFPLNPIDYLHRTGRTARAGATGRITSLVGRGDRVLAGRIEEALHKGLPLDALSSDRQELPPHMRPKPETLKRKALERKAEKHGNKGKRGATRVERGSSKGGSSFGANKSGGSFGANKSGGSFGASKGGSSSKTGGSSGVSKGGSSSKTGGSFGVSKGGGGSFGAGKSGGRSGGLGGRGGSFGGRSSAGGKPKQRGMKFK